MGNQQPIAAEFKAYGIGTNWTALTKCIFSVLQEFKNEVCTFVIEVREEVWSPLADIRTVPL